MPWLAHFRCGQSVVPVRVAAPEHWRGSPLGQQLLAALGQLVSRIASTQPAAGLGSLKSLYPAPANLCRQLEFCDFVYTVRPPTEPAYQLLGRDPAAGRCDAFVLAPFSVFVVAAPKPSSSDGSVT